VEKLFGIEVAEMMWLDSDKLPRPVELGDDLEFRRLTPEDIERFADDPIYELGAECSRRAESEDQFCFALLVGQRLASYSWYAINEVNGEHNLGAAMTLPSDMAYMYKAFTHPDFRGARLYATGIASALRALKANEIGRLLTTVHLNNFASLASCRRMGFERVGRLWTFGRGVQRLAIQPRARAAQLGIRFVSATGTKPIQRNLNHGSTSDRDQSETPAICG
jgi:hypothetical protein